MICRLFDYGTYIDWGGLVVHVLMLFQWIGPRQHRPWFSGKKDSIWWSSLMGKYTASDISFKGEPTWHEWWYTKSKRIIHSGKRYITMENHHFKFGTSTISMAIFNSYVCLPEGICKHKGYRDGSQHKDGSAINLDAETSTPTVFDSKIAGSVHHLSLRLFLERSTQVSRIQENNPLSPCKGALFRVRCWT